MSRKKLSTTVYLNPEHVAALHALHVKTQIPTAQLIRNALSEYLERCVIDGRISPLEIREPELRGAPNENEMEAMIERAIRKLMPPATEAQETSNLRLLGDVGRK